MNKELERVTLLLSKEYPDVDPITIYKVIRFGWDEVYKSVESGDSISVEFPKYGQWVIDYKVLSGLVVKYYDTIVYRQESFSKKSYERKVHKYFTLKHILDIVDKKVTNGYKVGHKKSSIDSRRSQELINQKRACRRDSEGKISNM